jgi:hypothetical protein
MHIISSQGYGKRGGGTCNASPRKIALTRVVVPALPPNAFGRIGDLNYFFDSIDEQVMTWRYSNLFVLSWLLATIK